MKFRKIAVSLLLCSAGSYCCNDKTKAYIWGNGIYQAVPGQGLSFNNFVPKLLDNDKNLHKLFFGEVFEAGITGNGDAYIWDAHKLSS